VLLLTLRGSFPLQSSGLDETGEFGLAAGAVAEEVPGFFVALVLVSFAVRGQDHGGLAEEFTDGEDVPNVVGDDVDGEVVDLVGGVGALMEGIERTRVGASGPAIGGLDLDAQESSVMLETDVVAGRVSPGFGNVESTPGGAGHEQ